MLSVYGFPFMLAMFVSFVLTPYIKKLAFKIGAVDKPDNRKVHKRIMPRLGGLAIYIAFMIAVVAGMEMSWDIFGILLGGTVIVALGVADDVYQLPAKVKLLGQIIAACILVAFDIRIEWVNNPLGGYFYLDMLSIPFTIFWVISFINVVNLIDGLDGLAAGVSAIVCTADGEVSAEAEKAAKEYKEANGKEPSWMPNQYFAALTNMRSVGVMGDERTYDYAVAVRAVRTVDFMTAEAAEIPFEVLQTVMSRIINEVKGVNRVFYDLTSKPPGTIEFE